MRKILIVLAMIMQASAFGQTLKVTDYHAEKAVKNVIKVDVNLQLPTATGTLSTAICRYANTELGGKYTGSVLNGKAMADFYANRLYRENIGDAREMNADPEYSITFLFERSVKKGDENAKYVTFISSQDDFQGGAHGMYAYNAATFRKSDGKKFGWDMLANKNNPQFRQLFTTAVKQYMKKDLGMSDADIREFMDGKRNVDLPTTAPYFAKTGVTFVYQFYELGSYSMGMPEVTIPYAQIKAYLTPAAKALIQ